MSHTFNELNKVLKKTDYTDYTITIIIRNMYMDIKANRTKNKTNWQFNVAILTTQKQQS